ncbi:MAG: hypothetical protein KZQ97_15025 [Candidatus Thiodiazotropha sp. (ex Dulcina madagascariensis)]|nr:hypothetical protein [Candidatus Thiodiazotropha sp. (ex Dulcina madagascariensis)]
MYLVIDTVTFRVTQVIQGKFPDIEMDIVGHVAQLRDTPLSQVAALRQPDLRLRVGVKKK